MKEVMVTINQSIVKARNFAERFDERYIIAYENNDLAIRYLSKIVKSFMEVFPNVQVELKMVDFQRKNTVFLEDKADFLFTVRDSIIKIPQTDYRQLYIGRFMCILSEKHELSEKKSLSFETLNGETLVLLNPSLCPKDVGRILRTFKIKKNVEVTDNGKIII
ncbi:MAG: LysR substrate-binding domain-containing protein [Anaerobutyricum sp.]|nr:LysR substrate-binding domain-containing protein [Anaerobutyricum sp.]